MIGEMRLSLYDHYNFLGYIVEVLLDTIQYIGIGFLDRLLSANLCKLPVFRKSNYVSVLKGSVFNLVKKLYFCTYFPHGT